MPRRASPRIHWGRYRGPTGRPPRTPIRKKPAYPKSDTPRTRYNQLSKGRSRKIGSQIRSARGGQHTVNAAKQNQSRSRRPSISKDPLAWWLNLPLNPWKKVIKRPKPPKAIPGRRFRNIQSY